MKNTETRTIDGVQFRVTQLGFSASRKALLRLSKSIGPALAEVLEAAESTKDVALAPALGRLVESVNEEDLDFFSQVFGESTSYSEDGERWPLLRKENQEILFTGRMLTFFKWLGFCIEVNYADFFDAYRKGGAG